MKNILMLNYEFPPVGGGGGYSTLVLAKGFVKLGYDVHIITSRYGKQKRNEEVDKGIFVHRVKTFGRKNLKTATFFSMLTYLVFGLIKGIKICRTNRFDSMITFFVIPTGPLGLILSKTFKIPNNLNLIGGDIYDPTKTSSPHRKSYWKPIIRYICNQATSVTAISSDTKQNAIKYFDIKKHIEPIAIPYVPTEFSLATRSELGLDDNKFYIVSIGRLVKRKGYNFLIEAISKVNDEDIHCLIISDGPERNKLEEQVNKLCVDKRVHFLGYLEKEEDKFKYLAVSDVYILSSVHEGFGIVLQEAMQVGLPIIATNQGGQVDIIEHGRNALKVNPKSSSDIADAIIRLKYSKKLRSEMSRNNLLDVKKYDPVKIAQLHENIIS